MDDEVSVERLGLDLVKDVAVRGESGIVHLFSYVVEGHEVVVAIHLPTYFTAADACRLYAHKVDTGIPQKAFCSEVKPEAHKVALSLGIVVIEGYNLEELREAILGEVNRVEE